MKQPAIIVALIASAFVAAKTGAQDSPSSPVPPSAPGKGESNNALRISPTQLAELENRALNAGDGSAAWDVAHYFDRYKNDHQRASYWFQISAENGYDLGQYTFAVILDGMKDYNSPKSSDVISRDRERACFWLRKALSNDTPPHRAAAKVVYKQIIFRCHIL
jgi:TPR repeat protein